jgi:hypothetical protein
MTGGVVGCGPARGARKGGPMRQSTAFVLATVLALSGCSDRARGEQKSGDADPATPAVGRPRRRRRQPAPRPRHRRRRPGHPTSAETPVFTMTPTPRPRRTVREDRPVSEDVHVRLVPRVRGQDAVLPPEPPDVPAGDDRGQRPGRRRAPWASSRPLSAPPTSASTWSPRPSLCRHRPSPRYWGPRPCTSAPRTARHCSSSAAATGPMPPPHCPPFLAAALGLDLSAAAPAVPAAPRLRTAVAWYKVKGTVESFRMVMRNPRWHAGTTREAVRTWSGNSSEARDAVGVSRGGRDAAVGLARVAQRCPP